MKFAMRRDAVLACVLSLMTPSLADAGDAEPSCALRGRPQAKGLEYVHAGSAVRVGYPLDAAHITDMPLFATGSCGGIELVVYALPLNKKKSSSIFAAEQPSSSDSPRSLRILIEPGTNEPILLRAGTHLAIKPRSGVIVGNKKPLRAYAEPRGALTGPTAAAPYGDIQIGALVGSGDQLEIRGTMTICVEEGVVTGPFSAKRPWTMGPSSWVLSGSGDDRTLRCDGVPVVADQPSGIGLGNLSTSPRR